MKKYIVVRQYRNSISCSAVDFTSDSKEDAATYADIMNRNRDEEDYKYLVAEIC